MKSVNSEIGCSSCRVDEVKLYFRSLKRRTETCVDGEGESGAQMGRVPATIHRILGLGVQPRFLGIPLFGGPGFPQFRW
jgi:hypothetical protein